ncbi:unnamed protein product [Rotaria socialis]|uniref:Heparan-alpha-glucosaminide N-acetyltransferase n=1 Tax=Rotaria socialis TaxID=392032 RepID=A0A817UE20_9BILA|nr:unnamed protein product [Rotaria socialis]CAF3296260.1 unnamed protein product [Rotaria socialis]CAF3331341.1 unnamed protein product [Rotaria socialis]
MMKSFYYLWIYLLTIEEFLQYGQAKLTNDRSIRQLSFDEAYITISNKNYSDPIIFTFNPVVCEKCMFEPLGDSIPNNENQTIIINTKYGYDFQLLAEPTNKTLRCQIKSYLFREHGSYLFEVIETLENQDSCSIEQTQDSSYYWLPIIIGMSIMFGFILLIEIWHRISRSRIVARYLPNAVQQGLINEDFLTSLSNSSATIANDPNDDIIRTLTAARELPLVGSTKLSNSSIRIKKILPKRLRSLDTFRGFSLMVMIFVNYGGGGYRFFKHSIWNGLTVADLVFPWFTWIMGVSIVFSHLSLRAKNLRKRAIFLKICRRTITLFALGLILQGGYSRWVNIRIFGVLQRLAACYFFAATLVLIFDDNEDEPYSSQWPIGNDVRQALRIELSSTLFHFWPQWLFILLITLAWTLITFILKFDDCPRGYLGPGGKHEYGKYQNCTGGAAGYIDRLILRNSHMDGHPTCADIYDTKVPYDPEGLLGILTGILLCYLGVQAGHSFAHSTRIRRVCAHWLTFGFVCGSIGLLLSKGGNSDSWIPINKNLWSLSFVLILAGLAFLILTIFYLLIDVCKWFTGEPFLWLGMNSIVIYVGHEVCSKSFPIQFQVEEATHAQLLAMHLYGVLFWTIVAGLMYRKKIFIAI